MEGGGAKSTYLLQLSNLFESLKTALMSSLQYFWLSKRATEIWRESYPQPLYYALENNKVLEGHTKHSRAYHIN